jgi:hypothetical protein
MICSDVVAEVAIPDDTEEHKHLFSILIYHNRKGTFSGMNVIVGIKISEGT